jgi:predicted nucleic acid-binding protein
VKPVLLDASVIVALLQNNAQAHEDCVAVVSHLDRRLVTCEAALSESCYLLRRFPGAAEAAVANVESGIFEIPFVLSNSVSTVRALMRKYRDVPASFADACLIDMADQLDTGEILTLDSDFVTYRWRRNRPFELLIPLRG